MCSVIVLRRPNHPWPVILAGNRDELRTRAWQPPARHWPDRPDVVAGLDEAAGGSWLGVNDAGVIAVVLNRLGTLGPSAGKRSRGELVLEALDHANAADAADALSHLDPVAYRPFNLVIADNRNAYVLLHRSETEALELQDLPPGLSMVTARDPNDAGSPRIARYRKLFESAQPPDPVTGDLGDWQALLAATDSDSGEPSGAMKITGMGDFATTSSAVLALPAPAWPPAKAVFLFAPGPPGDVRHDIIAT